MKLLALNAHGVTPSLVITLIRLPPAAKDPLPL